MTSPPPATSAHRAAARHGALLYRDEQEYLDGVVPFLREGLEGDEAVLVNADAGKVALVRSVLGPDADAIHFNDIRALGGNPARLLPVWSALVAEQEGLGRRVRGVGEPVWAGRRPAELEECALHEALCNVALGSGDQGRMLCPYDVGALPAEALEQAHLTHPSILEGGAARPSRRHDAEAATTLFRRALSPPPVEAVRLGFDREGVGTVRRVVAAQAAAVGLATRRVDDLALAVTEAATNSVRYGGGGGALHVWADDLAVVVDVRDSGTITEPMAGRIQPPFDTVGGRGLWIINQLCDLVQVRSPAEGANVRLHMWR